MSKHAEGPWEVRISEDDGKPYVATGLFILAQPIWSTIPSGERLPENAEASAEQRLANARLIAAAPEMLDALKYTIEQLPMGHNHGPFGECVRCKVETAIRKAEEGA
jgi:hypothetical protein